MPDSRKIVIAVIGSASPTPTQQEHAERVGALMAEGGALLVCGGLGGVMEAACKGAKDKGGMTLGIVPTSSRSQANPFVDIVIATGMGQSRNVVIVQSADAVIAVGGEFGTLSEIAHALRGNVPVIGLGTWEATNGLTTSLPIIRVQTPEEAVAAAFEKIKTKASPAAVPSDGPVAPVAPAIQVSVPVPTPAPAPVTVVEPVPAVPIAQPIQPQEQPSPADIMREVH